MAAPKSEPFSWEYTQKIVRIGHNRRVKRYFKDILQDDDKATGRGALKSAFLIRDEDSALETLTKMLYFSNYLEQDTVATYPTGWEVKKGQDVPQLAIIFRDTNPKSKSGDYTIHIPHYNGRRSPSIPRYKKGSFWARWILKDNSQIRVNAATSAEALRVIRQLEKYVDSKYQTKEDFNLTTGKVAGTGFKEINVAPIRADYYAKGKTNNVPNWKHYF